MNGDRPQDQQVASRNPRHPEHTEAIREVDRRGIRRQSGARSVEALCGPGRSDTLTDPSKQRGLPGEICGSGVGAVDPLHKHLGSLAGIRGEKIAHVPGQGESAICARPVQVDGQRGSPRLLE